MLHMTIQRGIDRSSAIFTNKLCYL